MLEPVTPGELENINSLEGIENNRRSTGGFYVQSQGSKSRHDRTKISWMMMRGHHQSASRAQQQIEKKKFLLNFRWSQVDQRKLEVLP